MKTPPLSRSSTCKSHPNVLHFRSGKRQGELPGQVFRVQARPTPRTAGFPHPRRPRRPESGNRARDGRGRPGRRYLQRPGSDSAPQASASPAAFSGGRLAGRGKRARARRFPSAGASMAADARAGEWPTHGTTMIVNRRSRNDTADSALKKRFDCDGLQVTFPPEPRFPAGRARDEARAPPNGPEAAGWRRGRVRRPGNGILLCCRPD